MGDVKWCGWWREGKGGNREGFLHHKVPDLWWDQQGDLKVAGKKWLEGGDAGSETPQPSPCKFRGKKRVPVTPRTCSRKPVILGGEKARACYWSGNRYQGWASWERSPARQVPGVLVLSMGLREGMVGKQESKGHARSVTPQARSPWPGALIGGERICAWQGGYLFLTI